MNNHNPQNPSTTKTLILCTIAFIFCTPRSHPYAWIADAITAISFVIILRYFPESLN